MEALGVISQISFLALDEVYPEELHTVLNMVAVLAGNSEQGANEPLVNLNGVTSFVHALITEFLVLWRVLLQQGCRELTWMLLRSQAAVLEQVRPVFQVWWILLAE